MHYKRVFRVECKGDGGVDCYRARFIAKGFFQTYGVDFDKMYAHVLKFISIWPLLAFATTLDLEIHQMDFKSVFLNGELQKEF